MNIRSSTLTVCATLSLVIPSGVLAQGFSDVSASHADYGAIIYLQEQGMVKGYDDGTFKPDQIVDRAAAVKMILGGLVTENEAMDAADEAPDYDDVPADAWYRGWIAKGVQRGFLDPPSKKPNFNGGNPVNLAEALKMLEIAHGMDPNAYSEVRMPLANDVTNPSDWFYPYVRAAVAASMILVNTEGNLQPAKTLTRGEVATLVYRLLMYKQNRRTQAALSLTETELSGNVLNNLTPQGLGFAKMAYARALLSIRGALTSRPDEAIVKGAVKITEGFGALVAAYEAGTAGMLDDVLFATGEAWASADAAVAFSAELTDIAESIRTIAHTMAEEARALQESQ